MLVKVIENYLFGVGWKKDPDAKESGYGVLRNFIHPKEDKKSYSLYEACWEQELIEMHSK